APVRNHLDHCRQGGSSRLTHRLDLLPPLLSRRLREPRQDTLDLLLEVVAHSRSSTPPSVRRRSSRSGSCSCIHGSSESPAYACARCALASSARPRARRHSPTSSCTNVSGS